MMNETRTPPEIFRIIIQCISVAVALTVVSGCATVTPEKRFTDLLAQFPPTAAPLAIERLAVSAADTVRKSGRANDVTIIVHPAYSLFFRDEDRSMYTAAKFNLLKLQFDNERRIIRNLATAGTPVILILPADYAHDSIAPRSYTAYLNELAAGVPLIYYLFSESSGNGELTPDSVVVLYRFFQALKTNRMLVGGGFVGRCQWEFYSQVATYIDTVTPYFVPELSSVSPDDISDADAQSMYDSLLQKDYRPVEKMLQRKGPDKIKILSLPSLVDERVSQ